MQYLKKWLQANKLHLLLEVEDPAYGDNPNQRKRRLSFYKKQGVRLIKGVNYLFPPLPKQRKIEHMLLLFWSYKGLKSIPAAVLKQLIGIIYQELFDEKVYHLFYQKVTDPIKEPALLVEIA